MTLTCLQIPIKLAAETLNAGIDMTERLASGETLSGTPTVTGSSDITLSAKAVNATTTNILGTSIAVGKAVLFTVAGGVAGTEYEINISCTSSSSQVVSEVVGLRVV